MTLATGPCYLVTGILGCVGAWTARRLLRTGVPVVGLDAGTNTRRLEMTLEPDDLAALTLIHGDVTDLAVLEATLDDHRITHVIHLAALQVPACRDDPVRGAAVNVVGTVCVFEAVKRRRDAMGPIVFAGSVGMFSQGDVGADGILHVAADAHPVNHYGVYKLANEGTARVYAEEHGVQSVALRPMTVYGVGRDFGITSGPTKAMAAAVLGIPYEIGFSNETMYQHADDVAHALVLASQARPGGAVAYNLPGEIARTSEIVDAILDEVPEARMLLTVSGTRLPFPAQIGSDGIEDLGLLAMRPLADGIHDTIAEFRRLHQAGRLSAVDVGLA